MDNPSASFVNFDLRYTVHQLPLKLTARSADFIGRMLGGRDICKKMRRFGQNMIMQLMDEIERFINTDGLFGGQKAIS